MNISIVTNSTMPIRYCETIRETINNYPGEGLAQTVLFDLLGGIIAAGFAYKFYQGIEVSHPVYSVLFSDIVLTTVLTFVSFLLSIAQYYVDSCGFAYINIWLTTISVFINMVSLTIIAFVRYHLLVTTKNKDDDHTIDLARIRRVALATYWSILISMFMIRGFLLLPNFIDGSNTVWGAVFYLVLPVTFPIVTLLVYYRMDNKLKVVKGETLDKKAISKTNYATNETLSASTSSRRIRNTNKLKQVELCSARSWPKNCDNYQKVNVGCVTVANIIRPYPLQRISSDEMNESERYGGVFVGDDTEANEICFNEICINTDPVENIDVEEENLKEINSIKLGLQLPIIQSTSSLSIQPEASARNISYRKHKNSIENRWPSVENLPNQVINKEDCKDIEMPIHVAPIKFNQRSISKYTSTYENEAPIEKRETCRKDNRNSNSINSACLDKISVVQEPIASIDLQNVNIPSDVIDLDHNKDRYKESKEHKSIMKSIMISVLYLSFLFLFAILNQIPLKHQEANFFSIFLTIIILKLYRTFATILTSIYCFEIVRLLFFQTAKNIKANIQTIYSTIRSSILNC